MTIMFADDKKKEKSNEKEEEINDELRQTFPASDPPSQTRPGHERDKKDE